MSNTILNVRLLYWHLQVTRDEHRVSFSFNPYQFPLRGLLPPVWFYP